MNARELFERFQAQQPPHVVNAPEWQTYARDYFTYLKLYLHNSGRCGAREFIFHPALGDATAATPCDKFYLYQDVWGFSAIQRLKPDLVVDIGSSLTYAAYASTLCRVVFVDIRPARIVFASLSFLNASITALPFADSSLKYVSSLCVLEHIGLGRYGDKIDPEGTEKACAEIRRVTAPDGFAAISVPLSLTPSIHFNAHRVFTKSEVLALFPGFSLEDELFLYPERGGESHLAALPRGGYITYCALLRKR